MKAKKKNRTITEAEEHGCLNCLKHAQRLKKLDERLEEKLAELAEIKKELEIRLAEKNKIKKELEIRLAEKNKRIELAKNPKFRRDH